MKSNYVKDLMVPLAAYATVPETATLLDAVKALKKAQSAFEKQSERHRAVLVTDNDGRVVGKVSQHDVLEALEPNYRKMRRSAKDGSIHRFGFNDDFVKSTLEQYHLWEKALENLCEKAIQRNVREIMYSPDQGEYIAADATLDEAVHRLIIGQHHSLLVMADEAQRQIVGVLRLADMFAFIDQAMSECKP